MIRNYFCFQIFILASIVFGLIYLFVKPEQRGFFCDDTSIQYPYKSDTIPMWLLGVYGGIGPVVIVSLTENEMIIFN
jgi:hypothetical protein